MAATNSAFADEISVTVEPDENEDDVEDHLSCSAASSTNEPADLSGISGAQTPGQQQNRNSVLSCSISDISLKYRVTHPLNFHILLTLHDFGVPPATASGYCPSRRGELIKSRRQKAGMEGMGHPVHCVLTTTCGYVMEHTEQAV